MIEPIMTASRSVHVPDFSHPSQISQCQTDLMEKLAHLAQRKQETLEERSRLVQSLLKRKVTLHAQLLVHKDLFPDSVA